MSCVGGHKSAFRSILFRATSFYEVLLGLLSSSVMNSENWGIFFAVRMEI